MKTFHLLPALALAALGVLSAARSVAADAPNVPDLTSPGQNLYVIERQMPGVGRLTPEELRAASQKSCAVLRDLGPQIKWQWSYVTGDKLYCVYAAPDEEIIREHAKQGGFPADAVNRVVTIISPETAK